MEIELSSDQQSFVRDAIASGRLAGPEEAVREALALWEERERRRLEILGAVDRAERSLASGQGRTIESPGAAKRLADDLKQRGAALLARESSLK